MLAKNRVPKRVVRGAAIGMVGVLCAACPGSDSGVEPLDRLNEILLVPVLMESAPSSSGPIHILAPHEDFDVLNRLEPGQARQVTVGFEVTESVRGTMIFAAVFRAGVNGNTISSVVCRINTLIFQGEDLDPGNLPPGEVRWEGGQLHCGGSIEVELF